MYCLDGVSIGHCYPASTDPAKGQNIHNFAIILDEDDNTRPFKQKILYSSLYVAEQMESSFIVLVVKQTQAPLATLCPSRVRSSNVLFYSCHASGSPASGTGRVGGPAPAAVQDKDQRIYIQPVVVVQHSL